MPAPSSGSASPPRTRTPRCERGTSSSGSGARSSPASSPWCGSVSGAVAGKAARAGAQLPAHQEAGRMGGRRVTTPRPRTARSRAAGRLDEIAAAGGGDPRRARAPGGAPAEPRRSAAARGGRPAALPAPMLAVAADRPFSRAGLALRAEVRRHPGDRRGRGDGGPGDGPARPRRDRPLPRGGRPSPPSSAPRARFSTARSWSSTPPGHPDFERLQSRVNIGDPGEALRAAERCPGDVRRLRPALARRSRPHLDRRFGSARRRSGISSGRPGRCSSPTTSSEDGEGFFAAVASVGLEGMIAKRANSPYQPGRRSPDWIKVKSWLTQSCAVAGWTAGHGRRGHLGALVLALRDARGWVHCGQVGTGFGEAADRRSAPPAGAAPTSHLPAGRGPRASPSR